MQDAQARSAENGLQQSLAALAASAVEEIYLWPCNLQPWQCWQAVRTQWRVGMAGRTGLDYTAVLAYLRSAQGLRGQGLRDVFEDLQACEFAVLELQAQHQD